VRRFRIFGCLRPSRNMSDERAVSKSNAPARVLVVAILTRIYICIYAKPLVHARGSVTDHCFLFRDRERRDSGTRQTSGRACPATTKQFVGVGHARPFPRPRLQHFPHLVTYKPKILDSNFVYPCSSAQMFKATVASSSTTGMASPSLVRSTALMYVVQLSQASTRT
jgi:hypothetical protein